MVRNSKSFKTSFDQETLANKGLELEYPKIFRLSKCKKIFSFSLIERVILSAGAMLIFSVSFQIDQMPEGNFIIS